MTDRQTRQTLSYCKLELELEFSVCFNLLLSVIDRKWLNEARQKIKPLIYQETV